MRNYVLLFFVLALSQTSFSGESKEIWSALPRQSSIENFPCSKCHHTFKPENFWGHNADKHAGLMFKHMPEVKRCTLCHSNQRPDSLNLQDGTLVSYDENFKLCGQCHGKIVYQWELGRHGKDVGFWNGKKTRWTCTECHNPHTPKFRSMDSVALPIQSPYVIKKEKDHHE